jgi:YbbR domain-containing protein
VRIPMPKLPSLLRPGDFARRMRRNVGLRIISVLIAVGLWIFVNAGQRGAVETLSVPISYRSLTPGLMIVNHPPDFAKIEVAGPRTLLSLLDPERMTVKLDLAGLPAGHSDLKLSPTMFNVPRQTSVTRITPDEVHVDVDRIVTRELPVHLDVDGQPSPNHEVSAVEIRPSTVAVSGPSRYVMALQRVETEPLELKGESSDVEARLALLPPDGNVHLGAVSTLRKRLPIASSKACPFKFEIPTSSFGSRRRRRQSRCVVLPPVSVVSIPRGWFMLTRRVATPARTTFRSRLTFLTGCNS